MIPAVRVYVTGGGLGFIGGHVRGRVMAGCDAVVHVAALYSYGRRDAAALARVNIRGT